MILTCYQMVAQPAERWTLTRNAHFEVYSQTADPRQSQRAIAWLEELRSFFQHNGLLGAKFADNDKLPLRVVAFRSAREYDQFRSHPVADAYYASVGVRSYIVIASLEPTAFNIAAHEYAHYVLHASKLNVPVCINEGLAEFFSTLHFSGAGSEISYQLGGDLPARSRVLRQGGWIPLSRLLSSAYQAPELQTRHGADVFYSESWALVNLLLTAPKLAPQFPQFLAELNAGSNAREAIRNVYALSLDQLSADLRAAAPVLPRRIVIGAPDGQLSAASQRVSEEAVQVLLAEVAVASGHLAAARSRYESLQKSRPGDPDIAAALGNLAFREGNRQEALRQWRLAIDGDVNDAGLCFNFAVAGEDDVPAAELKRALERAVVLKPDMDDARYKLALLERREGDNQAALQQLEAMHVPGGDRAYSYWIALASTQIDLDDREGAKKAAAEAVKAATATADKERARMLAYVAATDLTVQLVTDADGHSQMMTTRIPHGTKDFNAFIEPTDHMQRAAGKLKEVLCEENTLTGFILQTTSGPLTVDVTDPQRVLMRNSPPEFSCGPTEGSSVDEKEVQADYAVVSTGGRTKNILRGMTFISER